MLFALTLALGLAEKVKKTQTVQNPVRFQNELISNGAKIDSESEMEQYLLLEVG